MTGTGSRSQRCVAIALWLAGCSYDLQKHRDSCTSDGDCASGAHCYLHFCVTDGLANGDTDIGSSDTQAGSACDASADPVRCYEGNAGTEGVGACRAGMRFCVSGKYTRCLDQVVPTLESCNGIDDDCNAAIDDIAGQSCQVSGGIGGCGVVGTIVCRDGAPSCELTQLTGIESCNGIDDDCDGRVDENISGSCFPSGATGCEQQSNGLFTCHGVCVTGTLSCTAGVATCNGATTASIEKCGGSPAVDEDCDGAVDESCSCTAGSSQNCYGGPLAGAADGASGACGAGKQSCKSGTMGPCTSQSLPVAEDCSNQGTDDDCNGIVDDVKDLGMPCTDSTKLGACRAGTLQCRPGSAAPVCVGADPSVELCDAIDQDCDGNPVDGFDLNSQLRCGACDVSCLPGQTCCGGKCVPPISFASDPANCGGCGVACGSYQICCQGHCYNPSWSPYNQPPPNAMCCAQPCGMMKTCCGTLCVDLKNDDYNCGKCGNQCSADTWCTGGRCGMQ